MLLVFQKIFNIKRNVKWGKRRKKHSWKITRKRKKKNIFFVVLSIPFRWYCIVCVSCLLSSSYHQHTRSTFTLRYIPTKFFFFSIPVVVKFKIDVHEARTVFWDTKQALRHVFTSVVFMCINMRSFFPVFSYSSQVKVLGNMNSISIFHFFISCTWQCASSPFFECFLTIFLATHRSICFSLCFFFQFSSYPAKSRQLQFQFGQ